MLKEPSDNRCHSHSIWLEILPIIIKLQGTPEPDTLILFYFIKIHSETTSKIHHCLLESKKKIHSDHQIEMKSCSRLSFFFKNSNCHMQETTVTRLKPWLVNISSIHILSYWPKYSISYEHFHKIGNHS